MKSAVPLALVLILIAGAGSVIGTHLILQNQKTVLSTNIRLIYTSNEPYREVISLLNLKDIYIQIGLSDYYPISDRLKEYIITQVNKSLLGPKCFKISKEDKVLIEYPVVCDKTSYNSVVPIFVPGMKIEKLYLNYKR